MSHIQLFELPIHTPWVRMVKMITCSQGKLEKKLKQIPYQNIVVPRSCIRSGLATQNLFTLDIHRRIFRRVK